MMLLPARQGACVRGVTCLALACACSITAMAQRGGPPPTPRAQAPFDITGYWVSLVNEDCRYRMTMPPKGDFAGVPLNGAGRQAAAAWDSARDEASGDACKAYGAGGVMRMPGRLHIAWAADDTLRIEIDAGMQARTIAFQGVGGEAGTWQGVSTGSWDRGDTAMTRGGLFQGAVIRGGSLRVVTTKLRAGYLRKNGVPYSAEAVMTEFFDRFDVPGGESLLVVSTEFVDPAYLATPFWTSTHFKKQSDASGWSPRLCASR
jgi:hypothetical protein